MLKFSRLFSFQILRHCLVVVGLLSAPNVWAEQISSEMKELISLPGQVESAKSVSKIEKAEPLQRFNLFRETKVNLITSYSLASQVNMDMRLFGTESETVINFDGEGSTSGAPGLGLEAVVYEGKADLDILAGFLFEFPRTIESFSFSSNGTTVDSTTGDGPEPKVSVFTPLIGASVGLSNSLSLLLGAGVSLPLYANSGFSVRGSYHGQAGFSLEIAKRFSLDILYKYQRGELDQLSTIDLGSGSETVRVSGPASISGVAAQLKYRL